MKYLVIQRRNAIKALLMEKGSVTINEVVDRASTDDHCMHPLRRNAAGAYRAAHAQNGKMLEELKRTEPEEMPCTK